MDMLKQFDHHVRKQDKEHYYHLIDVALADGKMVDSERNLLQSIGRKPGFTDQEIENQIKSAFRVVSSNTNSRTIYSGHYSGTFDSLYMLL
ncbi:MAG: hypothetical protein KKA07_05895 [Bacteroidetes bacterium]|nr:hypothetical protein [Bacteroidota bacterium]MBU1718587.1 hypothetical protein [Bacteroidota bacterium]